MFVNQSEKQALLHLVLQDPAIARVLVFSRTKHGADRVVRHLTHARITSAAIHGNKSQAQRERALDDFRKGECRVLVATDIAARGIDVDGVTHVINFELPNVAEQYVHRIGRTARAGASGEALAFCAPDERAYLRDIEKLTRQKVEVVSLPQGLAAIAATLPSRLPQGAEDQGRARGYSHGHGQAHSQGGRGRSGGGGGGTGASSKPGPGSRVARLRSPDVQVHAEGARGRRPEGVKKEQGQGDAARGNFRRAR
jgi:ATP-dependent RNA helicase RhlE